MMSWHRLVGAFFILKKPLLVREDLLHCPCSGVYLRYVQKSNRALHRRRHRGLVQTPRKGRCGILGVLWRNLNCSRRESKSEM